MSYVERSGSVYRWYVRTRAGVLIAADYAQTRDGAFRAARNFIRHNQNIVFPVK